MKHKILRKFFFSFFLVGSLIFSFYITDNHKAESSTTAQPVSTVESSEENEIIETPTVLPPVVTETEPLPEESTPPVKAPAPITPAAPSAIKPATNAPVTNATASTPPLASVPTATIPQTICSLSVRCDTLLDKADQLGVDKASLVPTNGIIFSNTAVVFTEGETVFDVLERELKNGRVHLEFSMTPIYNSAYIEGMGNLYEFDCGALSGWVYKVNDVFPGYGCSSYSLKDGDRIEWLYTCDLGADVGGGREQLEVEN
ncbi:MAG: DUF4430 domain-containing protein [Evtepia sp.]